MVRSTRLDPAFRAQAMIQLGLREFDVLVIGGGVTGAGVALDAATRGLDVALVEARDYAAGTSSRSSKLLHGGLRYLEQLNAGLVLEALRERTLLLDRLCPHLARPVSFLYPLTHRGWERVYVGAGIALYDAMGGRRGRQMKRHRHLGRRAALRAMPALRPDALVGAIQYSDGQVDDARHTLFLARTAVQYGATAATSARVVDLLREGDSVVGARVRDLESGAEIDVRARHVINAAGVFTDELQDLAPGRTSLRVTASKGVHLVVPVDRIESTTGLISRTDDSVLFVIPWQGTHWLIGTTDTPWDLDLAHPAASARDIAYLLDQVNRLLARPLSADDVVGVYAGLRPLLAGESDATSKLSREHAVVTTRPGMTLVAGGKYTTYRVMAKDAVDAVVASWPEAVPASCTEDVPLLGADGYRAAWNSREATARHYGLAVPVVERLLGRYGTLVDEVLAPLELRPDLAHPLSEATGYLRAEALYAATDEGALHLDDVLTRRTRISIETRDRGVGAAAEVCDLVAPVLGWSAQDIARELAHYEARVAAERHSQTQVDDQTADAARLGAQDVRAGHAPVPAPAATSS
ncbi:MAG: Glycerol-3-phosphate dehydrogenase [Frankiales bacterium]|nr:Glycerol-3-phosphate dehydrogenase [Frankiales bacterium]